MILTLLLFFFLFLPVALLLHTHLAPGTLSTGLLGSGLGLLQSFMLCLSLKLLLKLLLGLLILDGVDDQCDWAIPDYLHVHVLPEGTRFHSIGCIDCS